MVRNLIIANFIVYLACLAVDGLRTTLALHPEEITQQWALWQFFTYMFVHGDIWHIVINMLMLWMFGCDVEAQWGPRRFLTYYMVCGLGAAAAAFIFSPHGLIGASGAVLGVMVAFGIMYAESVIYLFLLFPIKAKYAVLILAGIEFFSTIENRGVLSDGIGHVAHLGGMLTGYLYYKYSWRAMVWLSKKRPTAVTRRRETVTQMPRSRTATADLVRTRTPEEALQQQKVDTILDKIGREGIGALTLDEKALLDQHSRRLRESGPVNLDDYR